MTRGPTLRLGPRLRGVGLTAILVGIWILLWGELSLGNVLAGTGIAVGLLWAVPSDGDGSVVDVRPVELAVLAAHLVRQMVVSNALLARTVVSRESATCTGIVAIPMPGCSPQVVTVAAGLMSLSPGAMPVESERDPSVLYVHVLDLRDVDDVRARLEHLRDLTIRAIGSPTALAAIGVDP